MAQKTFKAIETTLKPKSYGKREQRLSNALKVRTTLQLFKPYKNVFKVVPYISANGKVTPIRLTLMLLHDSTTSSQALASRPIFVSTSLDPNEYETRDGRTVYADSNEAMMKLLTAQDSPYNSTIVSGSFGTSNIPFDAKTWDNVAHNAHAVDFINKATAIANASNLTDSVKETSFKKIYDEYTAKEQELLDKGVIVSNAVVVANPSSVSPTVSLNQSVSSRNAFFDSEKVLGNENSLATFAPMINKVSGTMRISDASSHGNWEYGLSESNGVTSFSTAIHMFDFRNQLDATEARIVVRDRFKPAKGSNQRTRTQSLSEFVESNSLIEVYDAHLRVGMSELGGLSSVFSLEGDDLTYRAVHLGSQDSLVDNDVSVNLDAEVALDSLSMNTLNVDSFNEHDFLASLVSGESLASKEKKEDDDDVPFNSVGVGF